MLKISDLLSDPKHHCKGDYAQDAQGCDARVDDDKADKWCLVGAVLRCYSEEDHLKIISRLKRALQYQGKACSLTLFNDHPETTHQMVLDLAKLADV